MDLVEIWKLNALGIDPDELSCVSGVYTPVGCRNPVYNSAAIGYSCRIVNWVTNADGCVHTADTTQLDFVVGKFVQTRQDCRQLNTQRRRDSTRQLRRVGCVLGTRSQLGCRRRKDEFHRVIQHRLEPGKDLVAKTSHQTPYKMANG